MERKEGPVVVVVGVRQLPQRIDRVSRVACACSWELGGHGIPTGTDSVGTRVSPASLSLSRPFRPLETLLRIHTRRGRKYGEGWSTSGLDTTRVHALINESGG